MKLTYSCVARSLIALLFVVAGVQKLTHFTETANTINTLGIPLPGLAAIIVLIIEIPVAVLFARGYKVCTTGWTLIAFTALVTLMVHGKIGEGMNLIMALKNIAIIGGIMLAIRECECGTCPVSKKKGHDNN